MPREMSPRNATIVVTGETMDLLLKTYSSIKDVDGSLKDL